MKKIDKICFQEKRETNKKKAWLNFSKERFLYKKFKLVKEKSNNFGGEINQINVLTEN
jgi:hypothetical protein